MVDAFVRAISPNIECLPSEDMALLCLNAANLGVLTRRSVSALRERSTAPSSKSAPDALYGSSTGIAMCQMYVPAVCGKMIFQTWTN